MDIKLSGSIEKNKQDSSPTSSFANCLRLLQESAQLEKAQKTIQEKRLGPPRPYLPNQIALLNKSWLFKDKTTLAKNRLKRKKKLRTKTASKTRDFARDILSCMLIKKNPG